MYIHAAAAAKSLQSCPTLWDPIDSSPPGSPSLGFSMQEHRRGLPFPSPVHESEKSKWSRSVVSDSSQPHGLQPIRFLHPWDFPGKSTGVGCHRLLRCTFMSPTQPTELDSGNEAQNTLLREAFQVIFKIHTLSSHWIKGPHLAKTKALFHTVYCHCSDVETKNNGKGNSPRSIKKSNLLLKAFQQTKTSGFLLTGI